MKEPFVGVERGKVGLLHQQNELNETPIFELELILAVGDVIASKQTLNINCGELTIGTPTVDENNVS